MLKSTYIILVTFFITGCSLFIGKLPDADPIFKAADDFGGHDRNGCLVTGQYTDCSNPTARVKKYLSQFFLPSSEAFHESLIKNSFICTKVLSGWNCKYDKTQAPVACAKAIRVVVETSFPADSHSLTENDIKIVVRTANSNIPDQRGCYPL